MNNLLSFSKARKLKAKTDKKKRTEENRIKFGRTKAEKELSKTKTKKLGKKIDDHKIE